MPHLGRFIRTLRHLSKAQIAWRIRYALERLVPWSGRRAAGWAWPSMDAPKIQIAFPSVPSLHRSDRTGKQMVESLSEGIFEHLHAKQRLGPPPVDWRLGPVSTDRLWTITLHYHHWAYDLARVVAADGGESDVAGELFRNYVSDWIGRCRLDTPGSRHLAWNSYSIATRVSWWIRAYGELGADWWADHDEFHSAVRKSLWQQAAYLHDHLEWDLRANHLLRDAVGLAWAGRFFDEPAAQRWLDTATRVAAQQAEEHVLSDGAHFERSPMYHMHVMDDFLSLALLIDDAAVRRQLRQTWDRMAEYLCCMLHPDGGIPLFNDAALSCGRKPVELLAAANELGLQARTPAARATRYFSAAGMAVWHGQPWSVFFDVGPVGPECQPGHAHADTLTFECSFRGRRLCVDPGTLAYDDDTTRRYDRSTAAHNTVCIDSEDSSEMWHIFRVGRRARPVEVNVSCDEASMTAEASHDGYDHLAGRPRHRRKIEVSADGTLRITDTVSGVGAHHASGGLLIDPAWTIVEDSSGWHVIRDESRVMIRVSGPASLRLTTEARPYHPEFGVEVMAKRLMWQVAGALPIEVTTTLVEPTTIDSVP